MPLLENVSSTYAMAAQTACVVDIGHTQTTVSCVDEGTVQTQSVIKKRYGGRDISELLYRLIKHPQALHYFPPDKFWPLQYPYHEMLLDRMKIQHSNMQMGSSQDLQPGQKPELVKIVNLWLKEQSGTDIQRPSQTRKHPQSTQITFNCSDALLLAPQALFYSELFDSLPRKSSKHETDFKCLDNFNTDWEDTFAEVM